MSYKKDLITEIQSFIIETGSGLVCSNACPALSSPAVMKYEKDLSDQDSGYMQLK